MNIRYFVFLIVFFLLFACTAISYARDNVYVVQINGTIDSGMTHSVIRGIEKAEKSHCSTVIFEINTLGGEVEAAQKISDAIIATKIKTIAFVKERAWSAGALIALACKEIVMAPGSSIGAAEPRVGDKTDEKYVSALRAEFASIAELRSRPVEIVKSMVDKDIEIKGINEKGKLLTLTANDAVRLGVADRIGADYNEALGAAKISPANIQVQTESWADKLSRILINPVIAAIFLILGLVGLIHEVMAPGHGIGGGIALIFLGLFFGSHYLAGASNIITLILFLAGVVLLIAEIFFIPGTGLAFFLGFGCIAGSIILSFDNINTGIWVFCVVLLITVVICYLSATYIVKTDFWKERVVLNPELKDEKGYKGATRDYTEFMGKSGLTLTPLRPVGKAQFDETKLDVVTEGQFVDKDVKVEIVQIEGNRIVVRETGGK